MAERLSHNQNKSDETRTFFNRAVEDVASDMTEQFIEIKGEKYRISLLESYKEENATSTWKKKIPELRKLHQGEIIIYQHRAGALPFIKAGGGADNILVRELQNVEKETKTKNPTEVTKLLGLQPGMKGKLIYLPEQNIFRFEK